MAKYNKDIKKEDGGDDFNSAWEENVAKPISDEVIIKEEEVKPAIKQKIVKKQISYAISGLSDALKSEALKMLADGASIKEVAVKYGIAPSDISILS